MNTILLTGGTGFLGSKIAALFAANGYRVITPLLDEYSVEHLQKIFSKEKISGIIHTATCYGRAGESWEQIAEANLYMPTRVLQMAEEAKVPVFINADTFFNEKIMFQKNESMYVKSKKEFLHNAQKEGTHMNIKFINLRIEQMYGPGDGIHKFVPCIINDLLSNKPSLKLTLGEQKRDFVYVDDVAKAFYQALIHQHLLPKFEEFGIGHGYSISIKEAVEYLKNITKSTTSLEFGALPYRENEMMDSYATISSNDKIGWKAMIDWRDGFKKTVAFYLNEK